MLTIGEVAARAGLRASAIRYYEAQRLIPAAPRTGGKRMYDASILDRLSVIDLAKTAGFSLQEIRELLAAVADRPPASIWKGLARAKRTDLDREISRLMVMKHILSRLTGCTCATLADCGRVFDAAVSRRQSQRLLKPASRASQWRR